VKVGSAAGIAILGRAAASMQEENRSDSSDAEGREQYAQQQERVALDM
jgi:hypothetical protein